MLPGGVIHDDCDEGTVGVERTDRGRPVRDVACAVRRSVDRVEDDRDPRVAFVYAGFLAHDSHRRAFEHGARRLVGNEIEGVLARPVRAVAPGRGPDIAYGFVHG